MHRMQQETVEEGDWKASERSSECPDLFAKRSLRVEKRSGSQYKKKMENERSRNWLSIGLSIAIFPFIFRFFLMYLSCLARLLLLRLTPGGGRTSFALFPVFCCCFPFSLFQPGFSSRPTAFWPLAGLGCRSSSLLPLY